MRWSIIVFKFIDNKIFYYILLLLFTLDSSIGDDTYYRYSVYD